MEELHAEGPPDTLELSDNCNDKSETLTSNCRLQWIPIQACGKIINYH